MRGNRLVVLVSQRDETQEHAGPTRSTRLGPPGIIHQLARARRDPAPGGARHRAGPRARIHPDRPVLSGAGGAASSSTRRPAASRPRASAGGTRPVRAACPTDRRDAKRAGAGSRSARRAAPGGLPRRLDRALSAAVRQELLELDPLDAKLTRLVDLLQHELAVRELGQKITTDTRERISKSQREYFLREQLRSIQQELGESEEGRRRRRPAEAARRGPPPRGGPTGGRARAGSAGQRAAGACPSTASSAPTWIGWPRCPGAS